MKILGETFGKDGTGLIEDFNSISDIDKKEIATMIFQEALKKVIICGCGHGDDNDSTSSNTGASEWDGHLAPWIHFLCYSSCCTTFP